MQGWNQALLQACPSYPDMRVYDWAAVASRQLVHLGRHPLHPAGVRRASPPDRPTPWRKLSPPRLAASSSSSCLIR